MPIGLVMSLLEIYPKKNWRLKCRFMNRCIDLTLLFVILNEKISLTAERKTWEYHGYP